MQIRQMNIIDGAFLVTQQIRKMFMEPLWKWKTPIPYCSEKSFESFRFVLHSKINIWRSELNEGNGNYTIGRFLDLEINIRCSQLPKLIRFKPRYRDTVSVENEPTLSAVRSGCFLEKNLCLWRKSNYHSSVLCPVAWSLLEQNYPNCHPNS